MSLKDDKGIVVVITAGHVQYLIGVVDEPGFAQCPFLLIPC